MARRRHSDSRSASPDDRRRTSKKRSRTPERSSGTTRREGSPHLSKFYRDRFGNQSPDSYNNLRLSNFDRKLSNDDVKEILESEFAKYKKFEVKLVRHNGDEDRFAYVNFEENGPAKDVRRTKIPTLMRKLGNRVCLDPTGVIRDQEGKYIPDRYNRSLMDRDRRDPTPDRRERDKERDHERRRSPPPADRRKRGRSESPVFHLNRDEPTRTLFVGNVPGDAKDAEIREILSKFGELEDVEIKYKQNGDASYAFVLFTSIDSADECQKKLNDKPFRRGCEKKFKIGFGKAQVSRKLWVGDLGSWTNREMLEKEFDRYGPIEELEYKDGSQHAYITFNDIGAATEACKGMQGNTLDRTHRISVDFAKITAREKPRKRQHSSSSPEDTKRRRGGGPRTPSQSDGSRTSSPATPRPESVSNGKGKSITSVEELREEFATTWKGPISLKKTDYIINLHRVAGKEAILQDYIRDEDGRVLKLHINQRLPLDDSLFDKITTMDMNELAVCIGAEHDKPLTGLVAYLRDKAAAGVITMDNVVTYIMGASAMSTRLIQHFAPNVDVLRPGINCVLVIVKKN